MKDKALKVGLPVVVALVTLWLVFGGTNDEEEAARIRAMLDDAIAAWEAQDLEAFMGFFDKSFTSRSGELSYGTMLLYHERLFGSGVVLDAEISNVEVKVKGDRAAVTFDGTASGTRSGTGTPVRIVGSDGAVPILIELEKQVTGGGISHTWKAVFSAGIEEGYEGAW